uniref:Reverse transcriptase Ty1/copia-type domain-containing protein n=1 Tax=Aegilops tauschii subsp. strangulata TaxID=200361 RepID=A0A453TCC9_AEGTS
MPPKFWAVALRTATYLLNIRPSSVNPKTTPFYSLFLSHPNYTELRVFGCLCFPNIYITRCGRGRSYPADLRGCFRDKSSIYHIQQQHETCRQACGDAGARVAATNDQWSIPSLTLCFEYT